MIASSHWTQRSEPKLHWFRNSAPQKLGSSNSNWPRPTDQWCKALIETDSPVAHCRSSGTMMNFGCDSQGWKHNISENHRHLRTVVTWATWYQHLTGWTSTIEWIASLGIFKTWWNFGISAVPTGVTLCHEHSLADRLSVKTPFRRQSYGV